MVRWVDYVRALNPDLLFTKGVGAGGGDLHERGAATDETVIATAFFAHAVDLVSSACRVVGHEQEAQRYGALAAQIREAFRKAFVSNDGRIQSDTQTAYALALRFGLLQEPLRSLAGSRLVETLAREQWHLTTGVVGAAHVLPLCR